MGSFSHLWSSGAACTVRSSRHPFVHEALLATPCVVNLAFGMRRVRLESVTSALYRRVLVLRRRSVLDVSKALSSHHVAEPLSRAGYFTVNARQGTVATKGLRCISHLAGSDNRAAVQASLFCSKNCGGGFSAHGRIGAGNSGLFIGYRRIAQPQQRATGDTLPWTLQFASLQTSANSSGEGKGHTGTSREGSDRKAGLPGAVGEMREKEGAQKGHVDQEGVEGESTESERDGAARLAAMRERFRDVRLDAREEARDWIRDKRDEMGEMRETLRDARKDGRLREELTDQAQETKGRLRELWRKYGAVGIGCYFSIYFGTIGLFYVVYDYGLMTSMPSGGAAVVEKMQEWMKHTPEWSQHLSGRLFGAMTEDHRARSLVLAWATSKVLEPLRLIAAIGVTPRVARALGRAPAKGASDGVSEEEEGDRERRGEEKYSKGDVGGEKDGDEGPGVGDRR